MLHQIFMKILLITLVVSGAFAATCEFIPPTTQDGDTDFGFIMIPGAQISGEAYKPLALKIQALFPGKMWLGLTDFFLADFPNPIEISSAIGACLEQASSAGLSSTAVFMGGHSLGGVVLESYISSHPELSAGIILFGSYLPDLFIGSDDNVFPVPVLTAIGTLDGAGLSYLAREARETLEIDLTMPELKGRFPVHIVDRVNHAQVASGPMPGVVTEQDIDAEIEEDAAHERYATLVNSFIITQQRSQFPESVVAEWEKILNDNQVLTDKFLEPFQQVSLLEQSAAAVGDLFSPWIITGQKILLGLSSEEELSVDLNIQTEIVSFTDLGGVKPTVEAQDCVASVQTYSHNSYSFDPLDFGSVLSADVIKAKFKLEDVILEGLCLPERQRNQCRDINRAAYELALTLASEEALDRMRTKGKQLTFTDDQVSPWGPGWEFSFGLQYREVNSTFTAVSSVSLISEPDFFISSAAGMHYCDLLSPYRALEWIYIKGVVHGNQ